MGLPRPVMGLLYNQNLIQSVLILQEQSKENTAAAMCYSDQKVSFDKVVKVDVKR
jgi:hypothetical protein